MANEEHLEILRRGVEEWNVWRRKHPQIRPDLAGAHLAGAYLAGARLNCASLVDARLDGALLDRAHLVEARLDGARFIRASLVDACLDGARLFRSSLVSARLPYASLHAADLAYAHLDDARLGRASFNLARLIGARLNRADFIETAIIDVDLSQTVGLETVMHRGPSAIATSTLERTAAGLANDASRQGPIETFYRGAGVEEHLIEYFRSRIGQPIQYFSGFISYSHEDQSFARRLYDGLQGRGIRCWLDVRDMKVGQRILDSVNEAIRLHDKVLLCCSLASLTSSWVEDELAAAIERERMEDRLILIPLDLDGYLFDGYDGRFGPRLRERLAADFTGWQTDNAKFDAQFEQVVEALRTGDAARETPPAS